MKPPILKTVRLRNFKAIRDSGTLSLSPLTIFIGNNGSGKSSLVEALQAYQLLLTEGLDEAFARWRGIQFVRNKSVIRQRRYSRKTGRPSSANAIELELAGHTGIKAFRTRTVLNDEENDNYLVIQREEGRIGEVAFSRDETGRVSGGARGRIMLPGIRSALSDERFYGLSYVAHWQFLNLTPSVMGEPRPRSRVRATVRLASDGANLAEYLLDIRNRSLEAFESILVTLRRIIDYATDLQPTLISALERTVYMEMAETGFKVEGWLLSTGTLRVLALLAVLRDPTPPPLIIIEEIENGLDPRSVRIILEEILRTVDSGRSQVVFTTHSPYLLDQVRLSDIVFTERDKTGQPCFTRPADNKDVRLWAEKFDPGKLYARGHFKGRRPPQ